MCARRPSRRLALRTTCACILFVTIAVSVTVITTTSYASTQCDEITTVNYEHISSYTLLHANKNGRLKIALNDFDLFTGSADVCSSRDIATDIDVDTSVLIAHRLSRCNNVCVIEIPHAPCYYAVCSIFL